ncbi:seed maturation protein PM36 [Hibiscus syriacus]|uniref:Seed maturation protein PM36 n=2 Tax=Hibiscus syriacus TaxID=106335 RepID=A0A6A3BP58_HIBSY|nr:seed maturation protein PM36 [Hibiscus syriacus]
MALALWFYDGCIPMNAVNSPLFTIAMSKIASMGHGYNGPSYHDIRVNLLKDAKQSVHLIVESYRKNWSEMGCTIMSDGWRDTRHRPLINFLVYCSKGVSFIKSVDASDIESNAQTLCNLFSEIVEIIGPKNVVHMVTDNAANYKTAGKLLCEKYPSVCWSPCAAHCINLIMKDIGELSHVDSLITLASRVTVFIYNHKWPLNWLRKRPGWTEIIRPSATRFGTAFIALKSLHDHKNDLQAMATSNDFKKVIKLPKSMEVKLIILDETFWKNCLISVNVMAPLLRLLRVCDSDEKPSLGYVYEGMYRAKNGIKKLFRFKKDLYRLYTNIIKARWDRMLRKSLHATTYWLNPIFQYDQETFCQKVEVFSGVLEMVEKESRDVGLKVTMQLINYCEQTGTFGSTTCNSFSKVYL